MGIENKNRRNVLKAGATVSLIGVTGCIGGGGGGNGGNGGNGSGGGTTDISVATAGGSSASELLAALQRVVHNESDKVRLVVQESPGDPANIQLYNNGDVNAYTLSNFNAILASNDEGPFAEQPVDKLAHQGIRLAAYDLHWVKTSDSGLQSTDDLPGANLYCLPPGWGFRQMVENVHKEEGSWSEMAPNVLDLDTADVPGAFEEGRIDASIMHSTNQKGLPSFQREVDARSEIEFLESGDSFIEAVKNQSSVVHAERDNETMNSIYEQDMGDVNPVHTMSQAAQLFFGDGVPVDAAYEVARISHERADEIINGFGQYPDHSNIELMYDLWLTDPKLPVHPGMANFLEENGHWDGDQWSRAEI